MPEYLAFEIKVDTSGVEEGIQQIEEAVARLRVQGERGRVFWGPSGPELRTVLAGIEAEENAFKRKLSIEQNIAQFERQVASEKAALALQAIEGIEAEIAAIQRRNAHNQARLTKGGGQFAQLDFEQGFDPWANLGGGAVRVSGAMRGFRTETNEAVRSQKAMSAATQEVHARFGVMANATVGLSTAMRLLGLEQGMAAVESGRLVLYFGRAITSGGGVASMFGTISTAIKGFMVSIGPVGWTILAVGAAFAAAQRALSLYSEAQELEDKKAAARRALLEEEASRVRDLTKARREAEDQLAVAKGKAGMVGGMSEQLADELGLLRGGMEPEKAAEIASLHEQKRAVEQISEQWEKADAAFADAEKKNKESLNERILAEMSFYAERVDAENKAADKYVQDWQEAENKVYQFQMDLIEKRHEAEQAARQKFLIQYGGMMPSDFMAAGPMRELALAGEDFDRRMQAAEKDQGAGFGFAGRDARAFQFGLGALGSVVGEQSEQKKTNALLEQIKVTIQAEARAITGPMKVP